MRLLAIAFSLFALSCVSPAANASAYLLNLELSLASANKLDLAGLTLPTNTEVIELPQAKYLLRIPVTSLNQVEQTISQLALNKQVKGYSSELTKRHELWSYRTDNKRLTEQQRVFFKLQRLYLKNGNSAELNKIMLAYKRAFTANKIARDVIIYTGLTGDDAPYIDIVRYGASKQDDVEYENKVNQAFGKDLLTQLSRDFSQFINKGDGAVEGRVLR